MPNSAPFAFWMNSDAVTSRSSHCLRRMKAMPTFSPWPTKLKPATVKMPSNASSFSIVSRTWSSTALVRVIEAPGGRLIRAMA